MPKTTTNYGFKKPLYTENADVKVINDNFEIFSGTGSIFIILRDNGKTCHKQKTVLFKIVANNFCQSHKFIFCRFHIPTAAKKFFHHLFT